MIRDAHGCYNWQKFFAFKTLHRNCSTATVYSTVLQELTTHTRLLGFRYYVTESMTTRGQKNWKQIRWHRLFPPAVIWPHCCLFGKFHGEDWHEREETPTGFHFLFSLSADQTGWGKPAFSLLSFAVCLRHCCVLLRHCSVATLLWTQRWTQ